MKVNANYILIYNVIIYALIKQLVLQLPLLFVLHPGK